MGLSRRELLAAVGLGTAAVALTDAAVRGQDLESHPDEETPAPDSELPESPEEEPSEPIVETPDEWTTVRAQFRLAPGSIHLAGLLIASHPTPVRSMIEKHRLALDENPTLHLQANRRRLERAARAAAAAYLGARTAEIALTDSTTMGLALLYNGLQVRPGQELLTTTADYYSTHESLRYKAARTGAVVKRIAPYQSIHRVSEDEIVGRLLRAVTSKTRAVTLTWVHSSTGLKIPVRRIAEGLRRVNAGRAERDRVLLCIDGVHGFGVEDAGVMDLGCDFFAAGAHKWLHGPRGSGILWGHPRAQSAVTPTIPTFTRDGTWGGRMTPGGFHSFEHQWALAEAFRFHRRLGRARVAARIHSLNRQLKEGLAAMRHVQLYTPMSDNLSAGITCFDVKGMSPRQVVQRLRQRRIIASTTPYAPSHARLTPGVFNTPEEIDQTLRAIRALA